MKPDAALDRCSFCGKDRCDGRRMVHGPPGARVCEPCVRLLARIMDQEHTGDGIPTIEQPVRDDDSA